MRERQRDKERANQEHTSGTILGKSFLSSYAKVCKCVLAMSKHLLHGISKRSWKLQRVHKETQTGKQGKAIINTDSNMLLTDTWRNQKEETTLSLPLYPLAYKK